MDLSWESVVSPKTWAKLTEDERAAFLLFINKDSFTAEEVATMLREQRKFIASKFDGETTLISNHVCKVRALQAIGYESNLKLANRRTENGEDKMEKETLVDEKVYE